MKPILICIALAMLATAIPSCHKENQSDPDPDPGPDGTKLSKVIYRRLTQPQGADIYEYHYDALNRITEVIHSTDGAATPNAQFYTGSQKWFYNGTEQLPYKSIGTIPVDTNAQVYYFYDANNRLVMDSLVSTNINCNCYMINKYNFFNDKVLHTSTSVYKATGETLTTRDSGIINNDNLTEKFNFFHAVDTGMPGYYYKVDNKINPLYTLNIHAAIPLMATGGMPTIGYNKNNVTELTFGYFPKPGFAGTFTTTATYTYTYRYNTANLPIVCELSGKSVLPVRVKFYYN